MFYKNLRGIPQKNFSLMFILGFLLVYSGKTWANLNFFEITKPSDYFKKLEKFQLYYEISFFNKLTGITKIASGEIAAEAPLKYIIKMNNLVGNGYLILDVDHEKTKVRKSNFLEDISVDKTVRTIPFFWELRDKVLTEWLDFHSKYFKYMNFNRLSEDENHSEYRIENLPPLKILKGTEKLQLKEGFLKVDKKIMLPMKYNFRIESEKKYDFTFSMELKNYKLKK